MSDSRKKISENNQLILFAEVEGVCPNCPNQLMYDKNGRKEKKYEIAHIYPLNPKPEELVLLKDEERLSKDPNHNDNLICLCVDCHTKFDKPRTIEEYRNLFVKKKNLIRINKEKSIWINTGLETEISNIIDLLSEKEQEQGNHMRT